MSSMRIGFHQNSPDASIPRGPALCNEMGVDEVDLAMSEVDAQVDDAVRDLVAEAAEVGVPAEAVSPQGAGLCKPSRTRLKWTGCHPSSRRRRKLATRAGSFRTSIPCFVATVGNRSATAG